MEAYTEIIEPTQVTSCVGCYFLTPERKQLIVAKTHILQIFDPIQTQQGIKLQLIQLYKVHGCITDLKALRISGADLDYVVVLTKYAKFSIVKWDATTAAISTVLLHFYEKALQDQTIENLLYLELLVEPTHSLVVCLRFKNLMTFLPFEVEHEDDSDDDGYAIDSASTDANANASFDSSFIMDAASLDSSLGDVIDLQFLHNYREPTVGVLLQSKYTWAGMLPKVKDNVVYTVLTVDLVAKLTVLVLKVENLPYDIDRVIALPAPLNGALLIGCNELLHVDNGGIVRRIAVNEFIASVTSLTKNYVDQLMLRLRLENCTVIPLPYDSRVLLIANDGTLYYVAFDMDGKAIKRMLLIPVDPPKASTEDLRLLAEALRVVNPGEATCLDNNLVFIGGCTSDAVLVGYTYQNLKNKELRLEVVSGEKDQGNSKTSELNEDDADDDGLYDDDDEDKALYGDESITATAPKTAQLQFVRHDKLSNHGPLTLVAIGLLLTEKFKLNLANPSFQETNIVSGGGSGTDACLHVMTPTIQPHILSSLLFSHVNRMWTINKQFLITSDDANAKLEIFQIEKLYARLKTKDFRHKELTIAMHELHDGQNILQVTPKLIVLYTDKFKKKMDMLSEISLEVVMSYLKDEFLMIFLASGAVSILSINAYNDSYTTIAPPSILGDTIITLGYITNSKLLNVVSEDASVLKPRGSKRLVVGGQVSNTDAATAKFVNSRKQKTFILVTGDNRVVAFTRQHADQCYQLDDIAKGLEHLKIAAFEQRDTEPDPTIKQVVFTELGDSHHKQEYLTVLTVGGEVVMYRLYFNGVNFAMVKERDLRTTGAPDNAYPLGTTVERRLVYFSDLNGYTALFVTGITPYLILKSIHLVPRIFKFLQIAAVSAAPYNDHRVRNGLVFLDQKQNARICELPVENVNYDNYWPIRRIAVGESITGVAYHEHLNTYVVATSKLVPYEAVDEQNVAIVGTDIDKMPASTDCGSIKLVSPLNWLTIDTIPFDNGEVVMSMKTMILDVGLSTSKFKSKREFVAVGTGRYRMEDLAANGLFNLYEIIDIIPEPGRPETNHKFKRYFREVTKGAVTAVAEVLGRFLVAQGQKIIVRDLQDTGVVSVAFIDTLVYVSEAKAFGNLVLLGDTLKLVWLVAFDAEPFRMVLLGKDLQYTDVNCADFICNGNQIYIAIANNNNVLLVLEYDPDDPALSNGLILIHRALFAINSHVTSMHSMPRAEETLVDKEIMRAITGDWKSIGVTVDGGVFCIVPLSESTYRRLYLLQQQMTDKEYHICGLNPRLNRFHAQMLSDTNVNIRPMLDYEVIRYFKRLNNDRRSAIAAKVSTTNSVQEVWKDLIELENVSNSV